MSRGRVGKQTNVEEPDPTYNFTIQLQDKRRHISDLMITGELKGLKMGILRMNIGLHPWALMGYHPRDIEGGL